MSNVFERVATSFGSTWKDQLADEMKAYIEQTVLDLISLAPPGGGSVSITEDPTVAGAFQVEGSAASIVPDPTVSGAYLIGE